MLKMLKLNLGYTLCVIEFTDFESISYLTLNFYYTDTSEEEIQLRAMTI